MKAIIKLTICICVTMVLFIKPLCSQSIDRDVYSTSGSYIVNSGIAISYNIGEPIVFTGTGASSILTQGFEQEDLATITSVNLTNSIMSATVFPNPVGEQLYINFVSNIIINDFELEVFDIQGKKINSENIYASAFSNKNFSIDFSSFKNGVYLIRLTSASHNYSKVFKISKM